MHFLWALFWAILTYVIGLIFDNTPQKKYAGMAAIAVFVLALLGYTF